MPEETTPDPGNSVDTPTVEETNWEQRYKDTQAAYTKSQQELAAERDAWNDEQAALARLAQTHPHLFEDETEPEDEPEPDEEERPLTRAEFKAWQDEQAKTQQQQTAAQQYEADLTKLLNGRELNPIAERAIRAAPVKNADELKKVVDEVLEYDSARAKPRPRAPHVPTNGQAATDVPNWDAMTPGEVNQYMAERVRGHQALT